MTTLSKEDVVRWAALSGAGQRGDGYGWNFMGDEIVTFATLARADLVAENKGLKETKEMLSFLQEGANDEAVIKAAICSTEQVDERIKLSVRACLNISTDQLRIAADARLDGLFKFKKRYEDQLTTTRTALAAAEAREKKLREVMIVVCHPVMVAHAGPTRYKEFEAAVNSTSDESALREMIVGVYEECAKACRKESVVIVVDGKEERAYNNAISDCELAIRALAEKAKGK